MRVLVQLVSRASVEVVGSTVSEIGPGLLVLVGIKADDTQADIDYLVRKIVNLRVFPDGDGVMNLSVLDVGGEILAVSQFTLMASCRRGNRPSYIAAAPAEISEPLYGRFCESLSHALGREVGRGVFGAHMEVGLVNDGPVTIWIDSADR